MATIIRKRGATPTAVGLPGQQVAFRFEDLNDRANEYLESVRREAAKIVQLAHEQAEQTRRRAETAGQAAAEETAKRALDQQIGDRLNSFAQALERLVAEMNDAKADWLRRWEQSAVAVAAAIAARIVRRELAQQPEISLQWIREALRLAAGSSDVTLHMNPSDYEILGGRVEQLLQPLGKLAPSTIVSDPAVSPGGCVVQTKFGVIDQQIEAQLARIQEELA
jgi:flagellar biosynthesis/type III secretory pathway protein FliH